ncbi:DUF285 domain-containing protein, partial [Enterococcus sp. ALS3]
MTVDSGELSNSGYPVDIFNQTKKIVFNEGVKAPSNSNYLFSSTPFPILETVEGTLDTSNVISMNQMFSSSKITSFEGISDWDVSNVTSLNLTFAASSFTSLDLSNWDTSSVVSMYGTFLSFNSPTLNISNWNTSNVTDMNQMFSNSKLISLDLNNWDTSNVTNMARMFYSTALTSLDLSKWNTSNVTSTQNMFYNSTIESLNLLNWDTSKVLTMSGMFDLTYYLNEITLGKLSKFNTTVNLPINAVPAENVSYTTLWVQSDPNEVDNYYADSLGFMKKYDGSFPGTYRREIAKTIGGNITVNYKDTDGVYLSST